MKNTLIFQLSVLLGVLLFGMLINHIPGFPGFARWTLICVAIAVLSKRKRHEGKI